jgi:hypothetical protein
MYITVKRCEVSLEDQEPQMIALALIGYATKNVNDWTERGFNAFLVQNAKEIKMAKSFALDNYEWIDTTLKQFSESITVQRDIKKAAR